VALAWRGGFGFGPYLVAHSASLALGNVALHFVARPRLPPRAPPLAGLFAAAAPLALTGIVQQAYFWADNGFVRAFAGEEELGRYNAAVRLFLWLVFFAAFATTSALPWLAASARRGALGPACERLAQPLFLAACLCAGLILPWSGPLLRLAASPSDPASRPPPRVSSGCSRRR
jgi:O-antigen/teichoic acid export membrane protein